MSFASARPVHASILALGLLTAPACVPRDLKRDDRDAHTRAAREQTLAAHAAELQREIERLRAAVDARDRDLAAASVSHANAARRAEDLTQLNEELRARLAGSSQAAERFAAEQQRMSEAISSLSSRVDEAGRREALAEALVADVGARLAPSIQGNRVRIALRAGVPVLELTPEALFDPGKATVHARGRETLAELGKNLAGMSKRAFEVSAPAPQWPALGHARAAAIVKALGESGAARATVASAADQPEGSGVVIAILPDVRGEAARPAPEVAAVPEG